MHCPAIYPQRNIRKSCTVGHQQLKYQNLWTNHTGHVETARNRDKQLTTTEIKLTKLKSALELGSVKINRYKRQISAAKEWKQAEIYGRPNIAT